MRPNTLEKTAPSAPSGFTLGTRHGAIDMGRRTAAEGADLLDVGGESTRPGAKPVTSAEEISRVLPVIERLRAKSSIPISIDTVKSEVARAGVDAGAEVVK